MHRWESYKPEHLALQMVISAAVGALVLVKYWRDTIRAVEHGQSCERIRFAVKLSPEQCMERLAQAGSFGLLRSKLLREEERTVLIFYPLTVRGWRMPLRRYEYAVAFEPGAMILKKSPVSKHALGQKVLRRYLEQTMR